MPLSAPKLDDRTAPELLRDISGFLPEWSRKGLRQGKSAEFDRALMQVVARFGELIINRLNRAPDKNFLAFLDLLGVSPLSMEAAQVPLTFYLSPGTPSAMVPAGTQVGAPPPKGEQRQIMFETDRSLFISSVKLDRLLTKNGQLDRYTDLSSVLIEPSESQVIAQSTCVAETRPIPHLLYVALPVSASAPEFDRMKLNVAVEKPAAAALRLQWEVQASKTQSPETTQSTTGQKITTKVLVPTSDTTKNLSQTGVVVFENLPKVVPLAIEGVTGLWLCCRLLTPLTGSAAQAEGVLHESQLALIKQIITEIEQTRKDLPVEQGFWNASKLDLTKDFYPFGDRPKIGDAFYLAQGEAFSNPDAKITLHLELTKVPSAGGDAAEAARTTPPQLTWEFWNGSSWEELGVTGRHLRLGGEGGGPGKSRWSRLLSRRR